VILHLVSFKYKPDIDAETRRQHRERLGGLKDIDGIVDLKVGADIVGSARSYDTGLAITFADRAALDAYQTHERHVPVAQHGASLSQHIVAVDFEID
jgi:stress responsive alpha/beta barrel protein